MSTLQVTNIKATGETASRAVSGVAAAWVNFNGTGTIAARDSLNVSSLTDNGTGIYTVAYSNNFDSADGYVPTSGNFNQQSNDRFGTTFAYGLVFSATQIRVAHFELASETDTSYMFLLFHGDLA
jgi:hypothetical protein